MLMVF